MRLEASSQYEAAVKVQAAYRGHAVRKDAKAEDEAAVKVQAAYRGHAMRKDAKAEDEAAVKVQAAYRGHAVRKDAKAGSAQAASSSAEDEAAVKVQAAYRGHAVRKDAKAGSAQAASSSAEDEAAVKVQAAYRGHAVRKDAKAEDEVAVKVQARDRMGAQLPSENDVSRIQALARGRSARLQTQRSGRTLASSLGASPASRVRSLLSRGFTLSVVLLATDDLQPAALSHEACSAEVSVEYSRESERLGAATSQKVPLAGCNPMWEGSAEELAIHVRPRTLTAEPGQADLAQLYLRVRLVAHDGLQDSAEVCKGQANLPVPLASLLAHEGSLDQRETVAVPLLPQGRLLVRLAIEGDAVDDLVARCAVEDQMATRIQALQRGKITRKAMEAKRK